MEAEKYSTFAAFRPHFDALARVGYFKLVPNSESEYKSMIHKIYRFVSFGFILLYNLQHVIRVVKVRHSTEEVIDSLFVLLTTINTLSKQAAFNVRSRRIDHLIDFINGQLFACHNAFHVKVMKENAVSMSRLLRLYHAAIFTCGTLWTVFPLVNRAMGVHVEFTAYFPFHTSESPAFQLALAYMSILITFQAYGNVTMDCTIVSLYSQGTTQLQMLRHDLENLVSYEDTRVKQEYDECRLKNKIEDLDHGNSKNVDYTVVKKRFVHCVEHYKEIVWFLKEVDSIFDEAMVVQFLAMAWVICMTGYKIVGLNIVSAEFLSLVVYLACMLAQLFIYCYYGTKVKEESDKVNLSAYCCNWLLLAPRFRKNLLVFMSRCVRPITPRAAFIIPLSLETYTSVLRLSYTLFTFLDKK